MLRITPFLLFDGNCADAMEFYQTCFGGSLSLTRLADTLMKNGFPAEKHNRITNAHLKSDAIEFSATDWLHPTRIPKQGNTTAIYVTGDQVTELRKVFARLSDGANKEFKIDLKEMPFGLYGRLTDKFGIEWFFRGEAAVT
jgi:PhnB protein